LIAIIAAMDIELKPLLKRIKVEKKIEERKYYFIEGRYKNKKIVLVKTGVGFKNAVKAVEKLVNSYTLKKVLGVGVAGAVKKELNIGDIVIPAFWISEEMEDEFKMDETLFMLARKQAEYFKGRICFAGQGMSVRKVFSKEDKIESAQKHKEIIAIDMESYGWSKVLAKNNIPFIVLKSISDTLNFKFPADLRLIKEKYKIKDLLEVIKTCVPFKLRDLSVVLIFLRNWKKAIRKNIKFVEIMLDKI